MDATGEPGCDDHLSSQDSSDSCKQVHVHMRRRAHRRRAISFADALHDQDMSRTN